MMVMIMIMFAYMHSELLNLLNCGCFHTTAKCVFWILNHDSKYGILDRVYAKKHSESWFEMRISNHVSDVFWSYASQITILDVFWRTHGQNTVFWIVIQDAHLESRFKSRFKIRTLPSCENSLCVFKKKKLLHFSQNICGFRQNNSQGFLEFIKLYEETKYRTFIFTIAQNHWLWNVFIWCSVHHLWPTNSWSNNDCCQKLDFLHK